MLYKTICYEICVSGTWHAAYFGTPLRCSSTTAPALSYYRPSMDICIALISYIHVTMQNLHFHRPWRSDAGASPMDGRYLLLGNSSCIALIPYVLYICVVLLPSIRPTWKWEVRKMQGAIFRHGHMHCPNKLHPCNDVLPYYLPFMAVSGSGSCLQHFALIFCC